MGFSADYVAGVWIGMRYPPVSGVTGGSLPAEIWHEAMVRIDEGLPVEAAADAAPGQQPAGAPYPQPVDGAPPAEAVADQDADRILLDVIGRIVKGN